MAKTVTEHSNVYAALLAAQAEFPPIEKGRTANVGKYSYDYADLHDVLAIVTPVLNAHGVVLSQLLDYDGNAVLCRTVLVHAASDTRIEHETRCPCGPTADPQQAGKAWTYDRRYSLLGVLGIFPAGEDDDAHGWPAPRTNGKPKPQSAPQAPANDPPPPAMLATWRAAEELWLDEGERMAELAKIVCEKSRGTQTEWTRDAWRALDGPTRTSITHEVDCRCADLRGVAEEDGEGGPF